MKTSQSNSSTTSTSTKKASDTAAEEEDHLLSYNAVFAVYDEALSLIAKELRELYDADPAEVKSLKTQSAEEQYKNIREYVNYRKTQLTLERNAILAASLRSQYQSQSSSSSSSDASSSSAASSSSVLSALFGTSNKSSSSSSKKASGKLKGKLSLKAMSSRRVSPSDLVHVCEMSLSALAELTPASSSSSSSSTATSSEWGSPFSASELQSRSLAWSAWKSYYISLSFASQADAQTKAYVMLDHACRQATQALRLLTTEHADFADSVDGHELRALIDEATTKRVEIHASALLKQSGVDLNALALSSFLPSDASTASISPYLLDRVDRFEAGDASKQYKLTRFPPSVEPMPVKPVLFDLASNFLSFNNIEERGQKKSSGGLFSFFRRS